MFVPNSNKNVCFLSKQNSCSKEGSSGGREAETMILPSGEKPSLRSSNSQRGALEHRSLPSIAASQLLQESEVRGSVEDGVLPVMETSLLQFNGPKNLHALALSGHGNFRRTTDPAPGGVQGRILAKAGFVGEDQRPVLPLRFFLRLG